MKKLLLLAPLLVTFRLNADVLDPVTDFKNSAHLAPGAVVYRWAADINGHGAIDIFLDTEEDFNRKYKRQDNTPFWYVYLQNSSKSGYVQSRGMVIPPEGLVEGVGAPKIDVNKMYIGPISQLGRPGIVTIETYNPQRAPLMSYISAYTIEGDHLKQTTLAEYEPANGPNAIYDQYLTENHRTKVKLEKITVK